MPLKTPICSFDAKTGILCPKCDAKLKAGQIGQDDVSTSIKLTSLAEKFRVLQNITLIRARSISSGLVLELGHGNLTLVRTEPGLLSNLSEAFNQKLWLIEAESSDRKFLEDLFHPVRLLTVNIVYLPDGSKMTKVIVRGRKTEKFPFNIEELKEVAKLVRSIELLVEFQQEIMPYQMR